MTSDWLIWFPAAVVIYLMSDCWAAGGLYVAKGVSGAGRCQQLGILWGDPRSGIVFCSHTWWSWWTIPICEGLSYRTYLVFPLVTQRRFKVFQSAPGFLWDLEGDVLQVWTSFLPGGRHDVNTWAFCKSCLPDVEEFFCRWGVAWFDACQEAFPPILTWLEVCGHGEKFFHLWSPFLPFESACHYCLHIQFSCTYSLCWEQDPVIFFGPRARSSPVLDRPIRKVTQSQGTDEAFIETELNGGLQGSQQPCSRMEKNKPDGFFIIIIILFFYNFVGL